MTAMVPYTFNDPPSRAPKMVEPGDYFFEVELRGPVSEPTFTRMTDMIGFTEVVVGDIKLPMGCKLAQASIDGKKQYELFEGVTSISFIGRLEKAIGLIDTPKVSWKFVHKILSPWAKGKFDSFTNITQKVGFQQLATSRSYEIRFVARMKSEPTPQEVATQLKEMGWKDIRICLLKKDIRLQDRPRAQCSLWYGVATWRKNFSYITDQDPFFFEDAILLGPPLREEDAPTSPISTKGIVEAESPTNMALVARAFDIFSQTVSGATSAPEPRAVRTNGGNHG
jgi:hypothetical protein